MKRLVSFAVGAFVLLGAASSAHAAGNVTAPRVGEQAVEVIVVKAKRLRPRPIDAVVSAPTRPGAPAVARILPAMPIEMSRLEFAVDEAPVVRL